MNTLSAFISLFEEIPASFWGVIVGSFFSIGGVALTNRANDKRLRAQFEHERELKAKDREMALRKEIYLDAAEAIAAGMNSISRFVNLDIPHDQIAKAYTDKSPAIAKVYVIARADTAQALATFTGHLGSTYLTLLAERNDLQKDKSAISIIDAQIEGFGKERDRLLEMIKQHNIEGIVDERRWDVLQKTFEFEQQRVSEGLAHRAELVAALLPKQVQFMRDCMTHLARLNQMLAPVLSTVRDELELPLDEDVYRKIAEASLANQQEAINAFVQKVMPATSKQNS